MAILTVNSGSSSLKIALYAPNGADLLVTASASAIEKDGGRLTVEDGTAKTVLDHSQRFANQHDAFDAAFREIQKQHSEAVMAVGHRVVHGGPHLVQHQRIQSETLLQLRKAVHFAPLHIPPAIELIEHTQAALPGAAQFACFDTAFHQTMPPEAYTYALPERYRDAGVRRFGFHGLSYESVVHALGTAMPHRTVVAHLGSGASACAMLNGRSVDTSMGLSPAGGFPMATRPGDLDPGVVLLLQRGLGCEVSALSADELEAMLNHQCGFQGLADESDVRTLLQRAEQGDAAALLALTIFYREIAKTIAGYFVVLGGIDLLVFTGGIGEHSSAVRAGICEHLRSLHIDLDTEQNGKPAPGRISEENSATIVQVMPADENGQIAKHVAELEQI